MADSRQLRRLVNYNQWADEQILAAIEDLSPEDLTRPREAYFGTIAQNLRHIVAAQRNWLARWKGTTPRYDEELSRPWREMYAETHAALKAFVAGLTDGAAEEVLRFTDSRGAAREVPLDQAMSTWSTTAPLIAPRRVCCSRGSADPLATSTTSPSIGCTPDPLDPPAGTGLSPPSTGGASSPGRRRRRGTGRPD
jgi:uncharacterized damage-inducible protein DinB